MSPLPTSGRDLRAVVRALADLTTQVKRIADYRQSDFALTPDAADDAPTTTADDAPRCVCGDPIEQTGDPAYWIHSPGSDTPCLDARPNLPVRKIAQEVPAEAYTAWTEQAPAADEDALRATRRESARIILDRATRGIALRSDESALLRQHFDAETREHDTARRTIERMKRTNRMVNGGARESRERAEQAQATIERVRQMADAWEQRLPETILTATAVEALRTALDGTEQTTTKEN